MNVIVGYKFEWNLSTHSGKIWLKIGDWQGASYWNTKVIGDAAEFGAVIQMLRAEYPLVYDGTTLKTMNTEEAGEDEGASG